MVSTFSVLTIAISILGLLGLLSFTIEKRAKDICIRKVFGAGVDNITFMLNSRFFKLFLVALILSVPISIWGINNWLEGFAYRVTLNVSDFLITELIIFLLPGGIVSFKSWRAANINPALILRDE